MLAIIIPYFKLTFFEATLDSLANQTDQRFKVYIGNDASLENPADLLEKYKGKFDFEYHRFEENLGGISLTQQWERCIKLSNDEEWLMILGDDDYLSFTVVASWYANYNVFNGKAQVIRFVTRLVFEETQTVSETYTHQVWESATDSFYRKFEHQTRSSLSEHIFSRMSYSKYGFYDYPIAWNSDDRAWLDFSDNKPLYTINTALIYIRLSNQSLSGSKGNEYDKNTANYHFLNYIVYTKLAYYDKYIRHRILDRYEYSIKKIRKLYSHEWLLILFSYVKYFDYLSLKKVLKRILKEFTKYES